MQQKMYTTRLRTKSPKPLWRKLFTNANANKVLTATLITGVIVGMLPVVATLQIPVAKADMLSTLKAAFGGYSTSQNPITQASTNSNSTTGQGSTAVQAAPTTHTWLCPDGQVESGIEYHRDAPSPIRCVPCPPGTVRMFVGGGEACHPPGFTVDYSNIPPGYEVDKNGGICLSDGQSYAGSYSPRLKVTYAGFGACCNGGVRDSHTLVSGSSVALFICGAPGSPKGPPQIIGQPAPAGGQGGSGNGSQGADGQRNPPQITSCPDGQLLIQAGTPPKAVCIPDPSKHTWLCPDGQVESGIEYHRDAPSPIRCVPCPPGTVRMFVGGGEACHPPGFTVDYSHLLPGYEVGANGQICLADGQSYAGSYNPRIKSTQANFGECCNGGRRDNKIIAGSVALFICGGGGGSKGAASGLTGIRGDNGGQSTTTSSGGAVYLGGPVDENSTFIIASPVNGSTITGTTVGVSYYSTEQLLATDYAVLQLDSKDPVNINYSGGGSYQFSNVSPGSHIVRGYLARANGTKIPNTSTSTTFTVR